MRLLFPLTLLVSLAAPGLALAQPSGDPPGKRPPIQIIEVTDADLLVGDLKTPDGQTVLGRTPPKFGSLIELRTDFASELLASVSEL